MLGAMTQPHTFSIAGSVGTIAVHDWAVADPDRLLPPVLLAHPTGFHGRVWAPVADRLVAAGHHVWSLDFRGHGNSSAPDVDGDAYAWSGFASDALAVIDHLGLAGDPRLVACGHSKGAAALFLGEARRPGTYARIWAFEPIVFPTDRVLPADADFPLAASAMKRRNEWASTEEAYEAYSSKRPLNAMTPESLRAYVEYGLRDRGDGVFELKCRPDVEAAVFSMAPAAGAWTILPDVEAECVIVCGEESREIAPPLAELIAQRLPRAHVEVWPGVGHFGPQQDPDACAASILRLADD